MVVKEELIRQLPKAELHIHLDGAIRPELIWEEVQKGDISLPVRNIEELQKYLQPKETCSSLFEYLKSFEITLKFMQKSDVLTRVAYELVEDEAKENVKYVEVRYAPILHIQGGLSMAEVIESVLVGLKRGEEDFGVIARLILCCLRDKDPLTSVDLAKLAINYQNQGVVAIDLAGDETYYPTDREHRKAFLMAEEAGLHRTVHAGEAGGPENIKTAIELLKAERIGHGARLIYDEKVMEMVKERGIPLEVCPTSNAQTKAVPSLSQHPLKRYYELGIPITINSDSPTISATNISQELFLVATLFQFSLAQIKGIILNGLKASFLSPEEKEKLFLQMKGELNKY